MLVLVAGPLGVMTLQGAFGVVPTRSGFPSDCAVGMFRVCDAWEEAGAEMDKKEDKDVNAVLFLRLLSAQTRLPGESRNGRVVTNCGTGEGEDLSENGWWASEWNRRCVDCRRGELSPVETE